VKWTAISAKVSADRHFADRLRVALSLAFRRRTRQFMADFDAILAARIDLFTTRDASLNVLLYLPLGALASLFSQRRHAPRSVDAMAIFADLLLSPDRGCLQLDRRFHRSTDGVALPEDQPPHWAARPAACPAASCGADTFYLR
jgi:hypothetical protein